MSISNPLYGLRQYLRYWNDNLTSLTDNYGAVFNQGYTKKSEEEFVLPKIKESIFQTLYIVKTGYQKLLIDQEKENYIESVFEGIDRLLDDFKKETGFSKYVPVANEELQKLKWNLHHYFDNELIALKAKTKNNKYGKIKMNLSKTEILHLFIMLRDMDYIDKNISNYALGKFLESSFLYFNSRKKDYMPLKKVAVEFGEIHSQASYSEDVLKKVNDKISSGKIKVK